MTKALQVYYKKGEIKMKKLLLAALGVCALVGFTGCGDSGFKYDYNGKGKLVSKITNHYSPKGEFVYKGKVDTIYDENGRELFVYSYSFGDNKKWKKSSETVTEYDADGNKIKFENTYYSVNKEGRQTVNITTTNYEYENGLLIRETKVSGIDQDVTTYAYDDKGNRISSKGSGNSKGEFTYDENNNLISETYLSSYNGGSSWMGSKWEYKYDSNNNKIETIISNYSEEQTWEESEKREVTYDSNNFETSNTVSYYRNGAWEYDEKNETTYNEEGNVLTRTRYYMPKGTDTWAVSSTYEITYNEKGKKTSAVYYGSSSQILYKDEFKYNKNGELVLSQSYNKSTTSDTMILSDKIEYSYKYYK